MFTVHGNIDVNGGGNRYDERSEDGLVEMWWISFRVASLGTRNRSYDVRELGARFIYQAYSRVAHLRVNNLQIFLYVHVYTRCLSEFRLSLYWNIIRAPRVCRVTKGMARWGRVVVLIEPHFPSNTVVAFPVGQTQQNIIDVVVVVVVTLLSYRTGVWTTDPRPSYFSSRFMILGSAERSEECINFTKAISFFIFSFSVTTFSGSGITPIF